MVAFQLMTELPLRDPNWASGPILIGERVLGILQAAYGVQNLVMVMSSPQDVCLHMKHNRYCMLTWYSISRSADLVH